MGALGQPYGYRLDRRRMLENVRPTYTEDAVSQCPMKYYASRTDRAPYQRIDRDSISNIAYFTRSRTCRKR